MPRRSTLKGSCHCGAIALEFHTDRELGALPVRECSCTFCKRHRPRYTSDPAGFVAITASEEHLGRYVFGLGLGQFLVCRRCGVFVAAFMPAEVGGGELALAVINSCVLEERDHFAELPAQRMDFDDEDATTRVSRRRKTWTPAALEVT